jgi:glycosyltransferase involved in cell wall biosynthesis
MNWSTDMQTNRNILIIVQNLSVPFDRRVWNEATSLRRHGFGVAVVCPKKGACTAAYERLEDIDIYRYPLLHEAREGVLGYFFEFAYCWLATLWLVLKAYAHRRFHAIHACNPPDTFFVIGLLFRPLGVKFVFDHHDLCPEMYIAKGHSSTGMLYRWLVILERMSLKFADAVITINESHRRIALLRGGVTNESITVVRNGPRCGWADIFRPSPELKRGRPHMVMYLGEMCEQDGVVHLLRAIQIYLKTSPDDTTFAFVGGGPDQPRLKAMAEEMGLGPAVYFAGRIPDEQLWAYLSTADLGVDPDPFTEWSNMSTMNKIVEYMAFGRPIVAFDLLENRRSAESAAVYVPGNDDAAMAQAIRELVLDPERREAMSKFARERFRKVLAWENQEKPLVAAYQKLLDERFQKPIITPRPQESVTTESPSA